MRFIPIILISLRCIFGFNLNMNANKLPTNWETLRYSMKENARNWFVNRAIRKGIPWNELYKKYNEVEEKLKYYKNIKENKEISYPPYFLKPFHGYENGNMNWKAAEEAESATLSIAAGYWENVDPYTAQDWMRYNISENIKKYFSSVQGDKKGFPNKVLDMGCSTGISTCFLKKTLPVGTEINGIDLSPYFIAVADYYSDDFNLGIQYYHENAEHTNFKSKSFDFVTSNFLFHELPENAAKNIIEESYRLLNNNGVIAIVDIDPSNLNAQLSGNMFRKWAFEVTEPHIYNYYKRDTIKMLREAGFVNIRKNSNDPLNSIWFGTKGKMENKKTIIQRKSYTNRLNYNILGVM